jgi:phage recombination protein Bet
VDNKEPTAESVALATASAAKLTTFAGVGAPEYAALKKALAPGAPDADFKVHLLLCQRLGIFPGPGGQAHFVMRKTKRNNQWVEIWTTQIGIDGYESLAEDTGLYEGPAGLPEYQYVGAEGTVMLHDTGAVDKKGQAIYSTWTPEVLPQIPYAAKVGVYRKGFREAVRAVATYRAYVQLVKKRQGENEVWLPNAMWAKMPHRMLAKCAESLALRQAFPRQLGLVRTHEEMGQALNGATAGVAGAGEVIDSPPKPEPGQIVGPAERDGAERVGPGTRRALAAAPPVAEAPAAPSPPAAVAEPVGAPEPAAEASAGSPAEAAPAASSASTGSASNVQPEDGEAVDDEEIQMSPAEQAAFTALMGEPDAGAPAHDDTQPPGTEAKAVDVAAGAEEA